MKNEKGFTLIELGTTDITDVRLMSYEEARGTGCTGNSGSCPLHVANQWYWLGSAIGLNTVVDGGNGYVDNYFYYGTYGIRPLVIINESALTIE